MKVVINSDFGGFGLSDLAIGRYLEIKGIEYETKQERGYTCFFHKGFLGSDEHYINEYDIERNDPALVRVVEELGDVANSNYSSLKVVEIPDDVKYWFIVEYDGKEHIAEDHRTWS
jgi:hypothetical protein